MNRPKNSINYYKHKDSEKILCVHNKFNFFFNDLKIEEFSQKILPDFQRVTNDRNWLFPL